MDRDIIVDGGCIFGLTLGLVILKALKVVSWSWLWVFSPLWIIALILVFSFFIGCIPALAIIGISLIKEIIKR